MSVSSDYVKDRLDTQISWHSEKSRENKKKYQYSQVIVLVFGALVPIVNVANFADPLTRLISSILSGVIAVVTGVTQLEKYHENWILYRTTAEMLKKEKYFFAEGAAEYRGIDQAAKRRLLVERVESIIAAETSRFFVLHGSETSRPKGSIREDAGTEKGVDPDSGAG